MIRLHRLVAISLVPAALASIAPRAARADVTQPLSIIDRARTLPAGEAELEGSIDYASADFGFGSATSTQLGLGAGYGITQDLDVHAGYGIVLDPNVSGKQPITLDVGFTFVRAGALTAALHVGGGVDLQGDGATPLQVGANVQYRLASQVAIFTGSDGGAGQLSIGLSGTKPVELALPVGVAVQATPQVYIAAQTVLATFGLSNAPANAYLFSDGIPFAAAAFYSASPALDVFVGASFDDLQHPSEAYLLDAGVRIFL